MSFDVQTVRERAEKYGELHLVLESDREYILHNHTVSYNQPKQGWITLEGMRDGEWVVVEIETERIEHLYAHSEV